MMISVNSLCNARYGFGHTKYLCKTIKLSSPQKRPPPPFMMYFHTPLILKPRSGGDNCKIIPLGAALQVPQNISFTLNIVG